MSGSLLRVWATVAGVALGAVVAADGSPSAAASAWIAAAGALACLLRRRPAVVLAALAAFGFGLGALAAAYRAVPGAALGDVAATVPFCELRGRVLEPLGGMQSLLAVEAGSCDERSLRDAGAVAAEVRAPSGSAFRAEGWLVPLGRDDFDLYRRRSGAQAELAPREIVLKEPAGLFRIAELVRRGLRRAAGALPAEEAALIRGLTIGDTDDIGPATMERFRRSGLSHLLAVSGSNVALVLAGATWLFRRARFQLRLAAAAGTVGLFVLVVGPDASVLRAAAMGAVGLLALSLGRQAEPLHALGLAVAVVICVRPQIVFSVGLHLSVAATAGIVLWAPRLAWALRSFPGPIALPLAVTASAQAAVLPVLVGSFGEISVVAPVANLLAAAAVAPATALGLIGGTVAMLAPGLGEVVLRAAQPFASWLLAVGELCAGPAWASAAVDPAIAWMTALPVMVAAAWTLRCHGRPITLASA